MPALDFIHDAVKNALIKDGWTITHDPYHLAHGRFETFVDLAAERIVAAERDNQKIAVEIKTFVGRSKVHDFEVALGQYMVYLGLLELVAPERKLFIAISEAVYKNIFKDETIQFLLRRFNVSLIIVSLKKEEIVTWIS